MLSADSSYNIRGVFMKKLLLILITALLASAYGCESLPEERSNYESPDPEISIWESEPEESRIAPEEVYEFLSSEYTVTAKRKSSGTLYETEYYLIDGIAVGTRVMTTLTGESEAEEFLELMLDDYPDATLSGFTVTYYVDDDEAFYYGYSLEKLKYVLEKAGYRVEVNFDEDDYNSQFPEVSED